jgi:hypothetical protein
MNFMDLYLLNRANKLNNTLNSGSGGDGFPTSQVSVQGSTIPNAPHTVPVLMTMNNRYGAYNTHWSSAINGEGNYEASLNNTTSIEQCFWGSMGGGMQPNADASAIAEATGMFSEHPNQEAGGARVVYAKDDRVGRAQSWFSYNGQGNYSPIMMGVMFVKNPTSSDIVKTIGLNYSTGSNGHVTGAGIATITPNNTSKTATTSATTSSSLTINAANQTQTNSSASATFAAEKTTAVVFSSSGYYWGGFSSGVMGTIRCHLTGLDSLFDGSLEPDLKMHAMALQTRNNNFNLAQPYLLWKECGDVLGDK